MDVKAILVVGTEQAELDGTSALAGGVPLATIDVLGRCVGLRTADKLIRAGAAAVYLVGNVERIAATAADIPAEVRLMPCDASATWRTCESAFNDAAQSGAEIVIAQRVGPYLELDYDDLIGFHFDRRNRVTPVCDEAAKPLDVFCLSASRRNDAAYLFRHQLREQRTPCDGYTYRGYRNLLQSGADLRRLAMDGFTGVAAVPPSGRQIRPGVWVAEGARIDRGARIIAPAFVGRYAKIRPAAVITRFSAVEHHCDIDCGTVVEDANVLPYTYVGAGLDVCHAVAGNRRLLNLQRGVEVEISDPRLINTISEHAPVRALSAFAGLVTYLPKQFLRGVLPSAQREQPAALPQAVKAPSAALKSTAALEAAQPGNSEYPSNLMVARRYGNE